jgi:hypothetical protein
MVSYDLCLLPALFRYVIINIRYLERHVQLADWYAPWKFVLVPRQSYFTTSSLPPVRPSWRQAS